ncbi:uncharacterized protein LOC112351666 [Selaginella moellendorffii]|uniref:uncharacterized protein LOC112351666 n=1 Tax=Selaginella moellendorffii TaxID=88036 RepID=UPI000D1C2A8E|nr:uncharacterized protein LOC112351666 [Selaginella moellendorffii]|eukprot:XP_024545704.1 uncharacterized protein LOC112351666 [Selaginella moellendorffii]
MNSSSIPSSAATGSSSSLLFPATIPQIDYAAPAARSSSHNRDYPLFGGYTRRSCHCIQLDTKNLASPTRSRQRSSTMPASSAWRSRLPSSQASGSPPPTWTWSSGSRPYPWACSRRTCSRTRQRWASTLTGLDSRSSPSCAIAAPSRSRSTRPGSELATAAGQVGARPVSISGMECQESTERGMISAGVEESGNTAVFEWRLLRWSHNAATYNAHKPHPGLSLPTKSLKAPFPQESKWKASPTSCGISTRDQSFRSNSSSSWRWGCICCGLWARTGCSEWPSGAARDSSFVTSF